MFVKNLLYFLILFRKDKSVINYYYYYYYHVYRKLLVQHWHHCESIDNKIYIFIKIIFVGVVVKRGSIEDRPETEHLKFPTNIIKSTIKTFINQFIIININTLSYK